ncbi:MAG TPA: tetratricopeptide repeat protein, partial [Nitrososphaera sp.]|nr:tetratricopeptide repeat protein [Nitrososphaera sp.]
TVLRHAVLLPLLVCLLQTSSARAGQDGRSVAPNDGKKRQEAAALFAKALELEGKGDYQGAIENYHRARELFPDTALLHYRIGLCLQKLDKNTEAASAFKEFLQGVSDAEESADARKRLDKLLLPKLSAGQKKTWETALDNLQAARELTQANKPAEEPIRRAVALLTKLTSEQPKHLPLYAKLGLAHELLGDHANAAKAYGHYLKGYEDLGYSPEDERTARTRRIYCATIVKQQDEERAKLAKQQDEERAKVEKRKELRKYLTDHGTCEIIMYYKGKRSSSEVYTVSFDGDVLVMERCSPDATGAFKSICRVDLKRIDPNKVRYKDLSQQGELSRTYWFISTE